MAWAGLRRIAESRSMDRTHFYSHDEQALAYAGRIKALRTIADWDFKKGTARQGTTYDEPVGGWREEARKCSQCRQLTNFTTARGRSVHPSCEGWVDDLTEQGEVELLYVVTGRLDVKSVEVE